VAFTGPAGAKYRVGYSASAAAAPANWSDLETTTSPYTITGVLPSGRFVGIEVVSPEGTTAYYKYKVTWGQNGVELLQVYVNGKEATALGTPGVGEAANVAVGAGGTIYLTSAQVAASRPVDVVMASDSTTATVTYATATSDTMPGTFAATVATTAFTSNTRLYIRVASADGTTYANYRIRVTTTNNSLLTTLTVAGVASTSVGTPRGTWNYAGLTNGSNFNIKTSQATAATATATGTALGTTRWAFVPDLATAPAFVSLTTPQDLSQGTPSGSDKLGYIYFESVGAANYRQVYRFPVTVVPPSANATLTALTLNNTSMTANSAATWAGATATGITLTTAQLAAVSVAATKGQIDAVVQYGFSAGTGGAEPAWTSTAPASFDATGITTGGTVGYFGVKVTAEDGTTVLFYKAKVIRGASSDATAQSITIGGGSVVLTTGAGTLADPVLGTVTFWTGNAANPAVTVVKETNAGVAWVKAAAPEDAAFTGTPSLGTVAQSDIIWVRVTAENGATKKYYKVTVSELSAVDQPPASELAAYFNGLQLQTALKGYNDHNPIITHNFGADPWVLVYQDRAYMYITGDALQYNDQGTVVQATYGLIRNLHVLSSADLVNWQDHGDIKIGGVDGLAPWANNGSGNAWAPCAASKSINGQTKFFVYWADSSRGIGVLTADSPTGPWTEPLGTYLVGRDTPTCSAAEVPWLFDPAVLVDDDGSAYLYFGGGVDGLASTEYTRAGRVVKLGADMISLAEDPRPMNEVRYLFEDSGINKIGNTYYYSYCTNWQAANGFSTMRIAVMTGSSPYGPFTYPTVKEILYSPSSMFSGTTATNNHHAMFKFKDKWYMAYHTQTLERAMKDAGVLPSQILKPSDGTYQNDTRYRNVHLDEMTVNPDGSIPVITGKRSGLVRAADFDPYQTVEAQTSGVQAGLSFTESGGGGMVVTDINSGDWLALHGVNFGSGAKKFTVRAKAPASDFGIIQLRLDSLQGPAAGYAYIKLKEGETAGSYSTITVNLPQPITGVHDLVFVFYGEGWEFDQWKLEQ
jgi:arabinoxylan arabinofuranohydrolase